MFQEKQLTYNQKKKNMNGVMIGNWFEESVLDTLSNKKNTFQRTMLRNSKNCSETTNSLYGKFEKENINYTKKPREKLLMDLYIKTYGNKLNN